MANESNPQSQPRWSARRKLLLQLAILPLMLLAVEGLFRIWTVINNTSYSANRGLGEIHRIANQIDQSVGIFAPEDNQDEVDDEDQRRVQNPYFAWDFPVAQRSLTKTAKYFGRRQGEQAFDILVLGGSVGGGFVRDGTARLMEQLAADPLIGTRPIRIHGRARGGFKQPQQVNSLAYLLAIGWKPDAVLNIDGFNELALPAYNAANDAHPIHPSIPHWGFLVTSDPADRVAMDLMLAVRAEQQRARRIADFVRRYGLHHSAFLGRLARTYLLRVHADYIAAHDSYTTATIAKARDFSLLGPPYEHEFTSVMTSALDAWEFSSISLQGMCDAHDIPYLHVLQPTLHDYGSKPLTEEEEASSGAHQEWIDAVEWGYPKLRERGQQLVDRGVAFSDCSMLFEEVEETLYYDACHFSISGQELFADRIARDLLELLD